MSRKKARIGQMQILYQMDLTKSYDVKDINCFLENFEFKEDEKEYINENMPILIENLETIDNKIRENLEGWSLERLANVDRAILRISVFELLFKEDIPKEVSINEAVEIAKNFSSSESSRFVNGILGSIYRKN